MNTLLFFVDFLAALLDGSVKRDLDEYNRKED